MYRSAGDVSILLREQKSKLVTNVDLQKLADYINDCVSSVPLHSDRFDENGNPIWYRMDIKAAFVEGTLVLIAEQIYPKNQELMDYLK